MRYLYIPLGGRKYQLWNIWVIFSFVAIWHDIQLRLLIWGWLICLFILPEVVGGMLYRRYLKNLPFARHLAAAGASLNILMMIMANLVGFCLGWEGAVEVFSKIFTWNALSALVAILACLFSAAQIMFELRVTDASDSDKHVASD